MADAHPPPATAVAAVASASAVDPTKKKKNNEKKTRRLMNRFQLRRQIPASWRVGGTAATLAVIALIGAVRIGVSPPGHPGGGLLEAAAGNDTGGYNARLSCWDTAADRKMGAGWFV